MGTRADFYLKTERHYLKQSDWLGSIAWDGYPEGIPDDLKKAKTPREFVDALLRFSKNRDDWTSTDLGWPWPWETSALTDYAYIFYKNKVHIKCFDKKVKWPDMSKIQNTTLGTRSGLIVMRVPKD